MFTLTLIVRLALAFAVGAVWVAVVTAVADRKGSAYAVLAGLPSTAAFSLFFIAVNQSTVAAVAATDAFPLAFCVSNAFLLVYAFFSRWNFKVGILVSLLTWFLASTSIVALEVTSYPVSLAVAASVSALTLWLMLKLKIPKKSRLNLYSKTGIALRGLGAGFLVTAAVLLSQIGGAVLGGVAAAFPAVYLSTLLILCRSQGVGFSRSTSKAMATSGVLTVIPYSVAVHYLYPVLGVWIGTLAAYVMIIPLAVLAFYLNSRY